ncbi:MAG TPA: GNAT family N-acetyltransferase [Rhodocyclaceae bacterium]|nr:GNAT family N-acetyltransferase [Rhodocyclaceae bacterium]
MLRFFQQPFLAHPTGQPAGAAAGTAARRWQVHPLNRSLVAFAGRWDALNQHVLAGHPMLDSRFVDALLWYFGDGSERLCHLTCHGDTTGLCILKPARLGVWTSFRPGQTQLAPAILMDAAGLGELPGRLPGLAGQVDLLCQDPKFAPAFDLHPIPHRRCPHVLTISIRLEGDFDAYWHSRSGNLRRGLRNRENRLAGAGLGARLVRLEAPEDMPGAVERFSRLESAGWKGRAGTAVRADDRQGLFYRQVLEGFARSGQAAVYEYWLGDRHAASELTIARHPMMILLKTAYDEELAEFAPGRLLLREIIRDGFARLPGGSIEFYTNAGADELAWATDQRWIEHVSLYPNRTVEQAFSALRAARKWIWERNH